MSQPSIGDCRLSPGEVHLWFTAPEEIEAPDLLDRYRRVVDEGELARLTRFVFAEHRHMFLVAHALVRATLSRYAEVLPEAWRFSHNEHGRPSVVLPSGCPPLRFNLSHTRGLALCGVVLDREIGVDVEDRQRTGQTVDIADRFFSPSEIRALRQLPPEHQRDRFFDYWTLKESYMKARGIGLALGLANFSFCLESDQPISIRFNRVSLKTNRLSLDCEGSFAHAEGVRIQSDHVDRVIT